MKKKTILSVLLAVSFIFVFGNMAWADRYRSEHHYYYHGDSCNQKKQVRHHQQKHYKKPPVKPCPQSYNRYCPTCGQAYRKGPGQHFCKKQRHPYSDRNRHYGKPGRHLSSGSSYFFSTGIFEPGFAMALSIAGR